MKLSHKDKILQESASTKLSKARELKKSEKYQQAIEMYHKVLFIKESIEALLEMAEIYEQIMDYSSAILFYKRSLQIMPRPDIKQKLHQLTLVVGLQYLSVGSSKNILLDTQFEPFIKRYSNFHKKILKKIEEGQKQDGQNSPFYEHLISCLAYLQVNHRKNALQSLQNCLIIKQSDTDVFILKGMLYWSLIENKKGYECFWKAEECDPKHQQIIAFKEMILPKVEQLYKKAKYQLISKEQRKCRAYVKQALQMYPHHTGFLILSSFLYRSKQEYQQALSQLQLANKTLVKNFDKSLQNQLRNQISLTYNQMGVYLFGHGKYDEAIKLFSQGLSYKLKDWGMLSNRGDCYKALNDFVRALADYQAAFQIEKKNEQLNFKLASIYNMRGIALFNSKNYDLAIKQFNESLKYSPKCSSFQVNKAKCFIQIGLKNQAIEVLTEAQKKQPKNIQIQQMISNLKENEEIKVRNNKKVIVLNKQKN